MVTPAILVLDMRNALILTLPKCEQYSTVFWSPPGSKLAVFPVIYQEPSWPAIHKE